MARPTNANRAQGRPERTTHEITSVLTAPKIPGYHCRFENDIDDNIQKKLDMGYEIVERDEQIGDRRAGEDSSLGKITERNVGGGIKAVLLRIPIDMYEQRQRAKAVDRKKRLEAAKKQGSDYEVKPEE